MLEKYRSDIDGLRALAVLSVMVYHLKASWAPGGFIGVDIFFCISGYVVTASLVDSKYQKFLPFVGEFYARRFARILPALTLVLVVSALLSTLFIPFAWLSVFSEKTGLYAFWGLSNWVMQKNVDTYFAPRAEFNPYTHTWSLGVEEQFYVIAPLLIYFWLALQSHKKPAIKSIPTVLLLALCGSSLVLAVWASARQPEVAFYFVGARFWELGWGSALFLIGRYPFWAGVWKPKAAKSIAALVGLGAIGASLWGADAQHFPWPWALIAVGGTGLLLMSHSDHQGSWVHRLLGHASLVWIGKRSYSIYLWHWPVYVLLRWTVGIHTPKLMAIAVLTTFAAAALSYRFFEVPLRYNATLQRRSPVFRIVVFALFPALGFLSAHYLFKNRNHVSLSVVSKTASDWYTNDRMPYVNAQDRLCQADLQITPVGGGVEYKYVASQCKGPASSRTLTVMGDSHARAYHPMFDQLTAETGVTIAIYEFAGCPYIDFRLPMNHLRPGGCAEFTKLITDKVVASSQPGDLVFLPSLRIQRFGDQWASFHIGDMMAAMYGDTVNREAAFVDAKHWVSQLSSRGLKVVFEAPKPIFKAPAFRCSDWFNQSNPICEGNNRQDRRYLEELRAPIVAQMKQLTDEFKGVDIWDPLYVLCPNDVCTTTLNGKSLFFDGDHPTAYGNVVLYPHFKNKVQTVLGAN